MIVAAKCLGRVAPHPTSAMNDDLAEERATVDAPPSVPGSSASAHAREVAQDTMLKAQQISARETGRTHGGDRGPWSPFTTLRYDGYKIEHEVCPGVRCTADVPRTSIEIVEPSLDLGIMRGSFVPCSS
jgi:hypothetical protein